MSNYNGQKRSTRKQKNKVKQQKRKVNAKRCTRNQQKQQQQKYYSDRVMNVSDVINAISLYCHKSILKNEELKSIPSRRRPTSHSLPNNSVPPSIFNDPDLVNVLTPSQQQIHDFIKVIFEKRRLAAETGIMGFVLMLRTNMKITSANWMRLIMVSLLLANKEAEDVYTVWNVRFVGIIPNLQVYEINLLEMEFLQSIKYRLHVEPDTYNHNYQYLLSHLPTQPITIDSEEHDLSDSEASLTTDSECSLSRSSSSPDLFRLDEDCIDGVVSESPLPLLLETTQDEEEEEQQQMKYDTLKIYGMFEKVHDKSILHSPRSGFTENDTQIESIP
eukprot:TRINITY_DN358_c0_g1_i2.p1 TRINITY_DN358_c0_g1~~TRINITY_DN358_c0_g1_i2.p1  ORF type:complete len:331 (-),score=80.56 TRINITY_DN358_c0_g1_i2:152-1144(-)